MSNPETATGPVPPPTGYTITTPRLILRTPRLEDTERFKTYLSHPKNYHYEADVTIDTLQPRIERMAAKTAAGESAFMLVFLRETGDIIGFGGFNTLQRTAMLNSAVRTSDNVPEESKVLAGDIGISIDHRYHRKGFAREAVCALTDFGFNTLGCGWMHMDTQEDNVGFRALMKHMGLPEKKGSGVQVDDAVFIYAWKSLNYDWDRTIWESVKENMAKKS